MVDVWGVCYDSPCKDHVVPWYVGCFEERGLFGGTTGLPRGVALETCADVSSALQVIF